MRLPLVFLGLSAQLPLQRPPIQPENLMAPNNIDFDFKQGPNIFTPKDLVGITTPLCFHEHLIF